MLAVAAILPLQFRRKFGLTLEIQLPKYVTLIFTLDWTLPRSEESFFVLGAKYSHFRCSLRRLVAIEAVPNTQHEVFGSSKQPAAIAASNGERATRRCQGRIQNEKEIRWREVQRADTVGFKTRCMSIRSLD